MDAEQNQVKRSSLLQAAGGATNAAINPTAPDVSFVIYCRTLSAESHGLHIHPSCNCQRNPPPPCSQLTQPGRWTHKPLDIPARLEDHNSNLLLGDLPPRRMNQTLQRAASALYPQRTKLRENVLGSSSAAAIFKGQRSQQRRQNTSERKITNRAAVKSCNRFKTKTIRRVVQ